MYCMHFLKLKSITTGFDQLQVYLSTWPFLVTQYMIFVASLVISPIV